MSIKTPRIKFVFDRKKKASKTTNGAVEIEVYYNGVQYRVATGVCVRAGEFTHHCQPYRSKFTTMP